MATEDDLMLEIVETWTVEKLKQFVRKRGLPVSGSKQVLAARAYVAWELKMTVLQTPEEVRCQKEEHMRWRNAPPRHLDNRMVGRRRRHVSEASNHDPGQ